MTQSRFSSITTRLASLFGVKSMSDEEFEQAREKILGDSPVPVVWLFGKTGSGKSSIIRYLTGATEVEVGNGFRPQTRTSRRYDFPDAENPVVTFLDTQGLGERDYDPAEDMVEFDSQTHAMVVVARVMDHSLDGIIGPLKSIRNSKPQRPVLLALTCLHEAYPGQQHPEPDPFSAAENSPESIPDALRRSIEHQSENNFAGLYDDVVPIDLTKAEDGFDQPNFGGERLKTKLFDLLPAAYRQTLLSLDAAMAPLQDLNERRAMPYIIGHATMAAAAAAVPVPWIDMPVVLAIQTRLLYGLARIYDQEFGLQTLVNTAGSVMSRLLTRMLVREVAKVIPFVGSAANAAMAFAYTYATGRAWCWYFGELRKGNAPSEDDLERIWKDQLDIAAELWKKTRPDDENTPR